MFVHFSHILHLSNLSTCPASFKVNIDPVTPSHACKALEIRNRSPPKNKQNKLHFAEIHEQSSDLEGYQAIIWPRRRQYERFVWGVEVKPEFLPRTSHVLMCGDLVLMN
jgi:hypothetical protein